MATIILVFTIVALGLLGWKGSREERLVVVAVLASLVAAPLLEPIRIGTWRLGVAGLDLGLWLFALALAFRCDRWWLTAFAGFQGLAVLTHLGTLLLPGNFTWTVVTLRLAVWTLICLAFLAGAWEAWADRKFKKDVGHDILSQP